MKAKKTLRQLFDGGRKKSNERSLSGERVKKALAQKRVYRTASVLACIVAFATTYMMILPAVTVEQDEMEGISDSLRTEISTWGDTYEVIASYDESAQIPDGAELVVREVTDADEEFEVLQNDFTAALEGSTDTIPQRPMLLDISIWADGQEIEPAEGSSVDVEVRLARDVLEGNFSGENAAVLVNDAPVTEENGDVEQSLQVLHQVEEGWVEPVYTEDSISEEEAVATFSAESFSNWLVYLDEDLTNINVTTGDSLTLRPYSEWIWKQSDELAEYQGGQWTFPSSDWNVSIRSENNVNYTIYTHKTNGSQFRSYQKTDSQLNETYTVITSERLNAGGFDLQTNKGKTIHVNVTQGASSGKPDTVQGVQGLKVNLFDYDVPYVNNQPDFAHSGGLDVQSNVASNPDENNNINTNHDLKFLGYGGSNVGDNDTWFWINNYTKDLPQQGIVKDHLVGGYPSLVPGKNGQERSYPSLGYLFDTDSHNKDVYAFEGADGLFQRDNQGFYYYNSNANYAEYDRNTNSFKLYEHTYSQNTGGSNGANAKPIGFFPFHEYDTVDTQPEMNFNKNLNHHFGMSMTVDFEIPKDRKAEDPNGNKHDIIYEFSGDDDLWVFVDDELALDIGGIHQPVTGTINFTTGEIKVHGKETITKSFDVGGHTLKMFYIERGGCDSNLSIRFNLPLTIGKGTVKVVKKSKTNDSTAANQPLAGAIFGVWEDPSCEGEPYLTAQSGSDGVVDFKELPVKDEHQIYYMKEILPPEGFLTNSTIFTLEANGKNAQGDYIFLVKDHGEAIETMTQAPNYPIVRDDRPEPISLTVQKQWQDAAGNTMEAPDRRAEFELKRYVTQTKYNVSVPVTVNVYRVGNKNNWTSPEWLMETKQFAGGTNVEVNWTYNHYLGDTWKTWQYRVGNGQTQTKGSGPAVISLPAAGVADIYIFDGNLGTQYEQYGVENIDVNGTPPSTQVEPVIGPRTLDETFSRSLTLPTTSGAWEDTFNNLTVQETKNGYTYNYEYFVTEKTVPEGYEAVYVDGNGHPVSSPVGLATNQTGTQTVINRKLLNVPITKHWPDFSGEQFTWETTFQLEEMEEKVNENDPDAADANTTFTPVEGRTLTVHKDQSPVPEFTGLPMYRVHSNGTVYRIQYSVEEIAYEVKNGDHVVAAWTKGGGLTVGDRYTPQFEQDAGEHGNSLGDYEIIVINTLENRTATREFDLDVRKTWPTGTGLDENSYAKFVLKRYVHEEYRDYSKISDDTEWVTVTLRTSTEATVEGPKLQTMRVPKGTNMHIVGNIKARTNANKIAFDQGSGRPSLELIQDNTNSGSPLPFDMTFKADADGMLVDLTQGDNYVVGGRDGFRLSDYQNRTGDRIDSGFSEEFILNNQNGWEKIFSHLSAVEEDNHADGSTENQTIHVYTYYLEEVQCAPAGFNPEFIGSNGQTLGDGANRVSWDAVVQVNNQPGIELPQTGGPGSEGLLILGGALALGAAGLLIRRKIRQIR